MNYSSLLLVLVPLIIGYLIPLRQKKVIKTIGHMLNGMVYIILLFMGISLAFLDDLSANLVRVFIYASVFFISTFSCNLLALILLNRRWPWYNKAHYQKLPSRLKIILDSFQLCGVVAAGFLLGLTHWQWLEYAGDGSTLALIFLLLLVGIQLRNSGMTLRQITINRRGTLIAVSVLVSALMGGVIAALLLQLPINTGFAIASGFGWYSLSGSVLTKSLGPVLGSAAFFNDLARELVAIMLIPTLIRKNNTTAVGICGATSMDFTLPILQRSGGMEVVPAAIVNGFILSLLAPILMALFAR